KTSTEPGGNESVAQTHDSRHATLSPNLRCQMCKSRMLQLSAILAAAAISLPLLVSTALAAGASPRTTPSVGTQLAGLKGPALFPAVSVASVSFAPADRQGAMSANWTV